MREKFPCKYIDEKETRRLCQNRPLNTVAFQRKPTFPIRIFCPKNHSTLHSFSYLSVYKKDADEQFAFQTFHL